MTKNKSVFTRMLYLKILVSIIMLFLVYVDCLASTFVGNGGNVGDVEIQVSFHMLADIVNQLNTDEHSDFLLETLCTCPEDLKNHPMCEPLINLGKEETLFCRSFLQQNMKNIQGILRRSAKMEVHWTGSDILVKDHSYLRAADAVINWQNQVLAIDQNRFVSMRASERLFLISHEIMHFLNDSQGQKLSDIGPIGPFEGNQGGRNFINALAASLVVKSIDQGVLDSYFTVLNRSRSASRYWFDLSLGSVSTNASQNSKFTQAYIADSEIGFHFQLNPRFALGVNYRSSEETAKSVSRLWIKEKLKAYQLVLGYRFFPSDDVLTRLGQSHFLLSAGIEKLQATQNLSDSFSTLTENIAVISPLIGTRYYLASDNGLWFFAGAALLFHNYKYKYNLDQYSLPAVEVKYPGQQYRFEIGVSYGF